MINRWIGALGANVLVFWESRGGPCGGVGEVRDDGGMGTEDVGMFP